MPRASVVAALALVLGGCALDWRLDREAIEGELSEGVASVYLFAEERCQPQLVTWLPIREGEPLDTARLPAGTYCLEVDAWSDDCTTTAHGVSEAVELPALGTVSTTLAPGCAGPCLGACARPELVAPRNGADVQLASPPALRFRLPLRASPHVPRADRLIVRAAACPGALADCQDALEASSRFELMVHEEDSTWELSAAALLSPRARERVVWRVDACHGARCRPGPTRYYDVDASARDLDRDGIGDILIGEPGVGAVHFYASTDYDRFVRTVRPCPPGELSFATPGDMDGDASPDVLIACGGLSVWSYERNAPTERSAVDGLAERVAPAGDTDADGLADAVVVHGGVARVLLGRSGGSPELRDLPESVAGSVSAAAGGGDLDGDGRADIALVRDDGVWLCWGAETCERLDASAGATAVAMPLDTNGDGLSDLVFAAGDEVFATAGRRDGALATPARVATGRLLTIGDLDRDGLTDLIVTSDRGYAVHRGAVASEPFVNAPVITVEPRDSNRTVIRARVSPGRFGSSPHDLLVTTLNDALGGTVPVIPIVELHAWDGNAGFVGGLSSPGGVGPSGGGHISFGDVL